MNSGPVISVDRAVAHFFDGITIEEQEVANFYGLLPHENKPPLEECHIHFTALAHIDGNITGYGVYIPDKKASHLDPQAPPADIVIFLGSLLASKSRISPAQVLAHELVHYAQGPRPLADSAKQEIEDVSALLIERSMYSGTISKAHFLLGSALLGGVHYAATEIFGDGHVGISAVAGVAITGLSRWRDRKKRQELAYAAEEKLFNITHQQQHEIEARAHEEMSEEAVTLQPSIKANRQVMVRKKSDFFKQNVIHNRIIDATHKILSLSPSSVTFK